MRAPYLLDHKLLRRVPKRDPDLSPVALNILQNEATNPTATEQESRRTQKTRTSDRNKRQPRWNVRRRWHGSLGVKNRKAIKVGATAQGGPEVSDVRRWP
jgi:hypothetical protein